MAQKDGQGAGLITNYHDSEQDVIGVTTDTLEDLRDSGNEEFLQFFIAEFFVAGALWVAIEQGFEAHRNNTDYSPLFWVCLTAVVMGLAVGYAGFKQLKRRKRKIDRIIDRSINKDGDT